MSLGAEVLLVGEDGEALPLAILKSGDSTTLADYSGPEGCRIYEVLTSIEGQTAIFFSREANFNPSDILSHESVYEKTGRVSLLEPGEEYTQERYSSSVSAQVGKLIVRNIFGMTIDALPTTTQPIVET